MIQDELSTSDGESPGSGNDSGDEASASSSPEDSTGDGGSGSGSAPRLGSSTSVDRDDAAAVLGVTMGASSQAALAPELQSPSRIVEARMVKVGTAFQAAVPPELFRHPPALRTVYPPRCLWRGDASKLSHNAVSTFVAAATKLVTPLQRGMRVGARHPKAGMMQPAVLVSVDASTQDANADADAGDGEADGSGTVLVRFVGERQTTCVAVDDVVPHEAMAASKPAAALEEVRAPLPSGFLRDCTLTSPMCVVSPGSCCMPTMTQVTRCPRWRVTHVRIRATGQATTSQAACTLGGRTATSSTSRRASIGASRGLPHERSGGGGGGCGCVECRGYNGSHCWGHRFGCDFAAIRRHFLKHMTTAAVVEFYGYHRYRFGRNYKPQWLRHITLSAADDGASQASSGTDPSAATSESRGGAAGAGAGAGAGRRSKRRTASHTCFLCMEVRQSFVQCTNPQCRIGVCSGCFAADVSQWRGRNSQVWEDQVKNQFWLCQLCLPPTQEAESAPQKKSRGRSRLDHDRKRLCVRRAQHGAGTARSNPSSRCCVVCSIVQASNCVCARPRQREHHGGGAEIPARCASKLRRRRIQDVHHVLAPAPQLRPRRGWHRQGCVNNPALV